MFYDPILDIWTPKTDMATGRAAFSTCVFNGKIYAFGGGRSIYYDPMNSIEEYDPVTTFNYRLDQAGMVNLVIYDLLGQKVTTLVDEVKYPGSYAVTWNAEDFVSGIYICRVGRCSVYEASQVPGVDTKTIEAGSCAGALIFMNTMVKQLNPDLNYKLREFRSAADDFCEEEIVLG